jgi:hypothetical protein
MIRGYRDNAANERTFTGPSVLEARPEQFPARPPVQ